MSSAAQQGEGTVLETPLGLGTPSIEDVQLSLLGHPVLGTFWEQTHGSGDGCLRRHSSSGGIPLGNQLWGTVAGIAGGASAWDTALGTHNKAGSESSPLGTC